MMNDFTSDKLQDDPGDTSVFIRLRAYFIGGLLVTAPIGITVYLTWLFLSFIDSRVNAIIPEGLNPFTYWPTGVPGLDILKAITSLVLVILFFILVGWFARNFFGRIIYNMAEYVVHRMPVVRTIYGALKQVLETIMASQSQAFRDVVLFEYPRRGSYAIGFVTGRTQGEVQRITSEDTMNVFVPTTPNPTSGFLLMVPRKDLHFLDMTVEEAAKLVVSGGILTPPDRAVEESGTAELPLNSNEKNGKNGKNNKSGDKS